MSICAWVETGNAKKGIELLNELEDCSEEDQRQKIIELNELMKHMNCKEFRFVFTTDLFNRISKMIDEKKISLKNVYLLLKRLGYCKIMKGPWIDVFEKSSLSGKIQNAMISESKKKNEERNDNLLVDLCECYLTLYKDHSPFLKWLFMPCLLKVALKKDENEVTQKEVEMALLALSNIGNNKLDEELYLNKIKRIVKYHQMHHNLTCLAYQSAWEILVRKFYNYNYMRRFRVGRRFHTGEEPFEEVELNELHFAREAARELDELTKCVDYQIKEEKEKVQKTEEMSLLMRWLQILGLYFCLCKLWNLEFLVLLCNVAKVYQAVKDYFRKICRLCIDVFEAASESNGVKIYDLWGSGADDVILEQFHKSTLDDKMACKGLEFYVYASRRLNEKEGFPFEEAKRKRLKRKVFEKMEEEGYEDCILSFHKTFNFHQKKSHSSKLSLNVYDYFIYV
ncbi:uncharacterized protein MONOS_16148 [Monocercomonoides exilis]|uniref:uncharacterized protein n=1 Tax=Monocercomonoides exilis TaxID=2049356 RepID=UPI003559BD33|nr:hypothetical protein MONOS_16148 [Monocercomonoides exilis]